jgi:hypothetical protein
MDILYTYTHSHIVPNKNVQYTNAHDFNKAWYNYWATYSLSPCATIERHSCKPLAQMNFTIKSDISAVRLLAFVREFSGSILCRNIDYSEVFSVPPGKFWVNTSITQRLCPSIYFLIHSSLIIFPFDAIKFELLTSVLNRPEVKPCNLHGLDEGR